MKQFQYKYGAGEIVRYERGERGANCFRFDRYTPNNGEPASVERHFAASETDQTPLHSISTGYKAECSCCWLGFSHTEAAHAERIGAK